MLPGIDGCVEIEACPLGMTLLTREGLERMEAHYKADRLDYEALGTINSKDGAESLASFAKRIAKLARDNPILAFEDESSIVPGGRVPSVALFQLLFEEKTGGLLSEDYSFCARWRAIGQKVWMYLGEGSPVSHQGEMIFAGAIEAFGLQRSGG
jgi:hypothetical protein